MRRWLATVLALLALTACDDGVLELAVVFGGTLEVGAATPRDGVLLVLDGDLRLEPSALLRGTVVVLGGRAVLDGRVVGDVIALSGAVLLGEEAHLTGDLAVAGDLERHPLARVDGRVTLGSAVPETFAGLLRAGPSSWRSVLGRALWLALLGALATRFAGRAVRRLVEAVRRHTLTALALGTLALVVGLVLVVVMAFTVVLIPVSLLGLVLGLLAMLAGWSSVGIALGALVARRLGARTAPGWSQAMAAALGVFAVATLLGAMERVPFVGGLVALGVSAVGLGAVLLTGFGSRRFVPEDAPGEFA